MLRKWPNEHNIMRLALALGCRIGKSRQDCEELNLNRNLVSQERLLTPILYSIGLKQLQSLVTFILVFIIKMQ